MIKLVYDVRCGFKQLYMTEKDCEYFLDDQFDPDMLKNSGFPDDEPMPKAEDFYAWAKEATQSELEEYFTDNGILGCIEDCTVEDYMHKYFKDICKEQNCAPGYTKIYNLRVEYDPTVIVKFLAESTGRSVAAHYYKDGKEIDLDTEDQIESTTMKANDVMAYLGISRQTLSNYVKRGLIKIDSNYTGKQYRYDRESVIALKKNR